MKTTLIVVVIVIVASAVQACCFCRLSRYRWTQPPLVLPPVLKASSFPPPR
jgi:hypothetical protein